MQTVTGVTPSATRSAKFQASAPPQKLIGTRPSSSSSTSRASVSVSGWSARPDMYIIFSFEGKTGRWFTTSRVFESFTPKSRPEARAVSASRFTIGRASSNFGS